MSPQVLISALGETRNGSEHAQPGNLIAGSLLQTQSFFADHFLANPSAVHSLSQVKHQLRVLMLNTGLNHPTFRQWAETMWEI